MAEVTVAAVAVIAVCFGASAVLKLRAGSAYGMYRSGLAEARLVPDRLLPAVAASLAATEAIIGAAAIAALALTMSGNNVIPLEAAALGCGVLLSALLTLGVAVVLARGTRARCSCFGSGASKPLGLLHLARNVALLTILSLGLAAGIVTSGQPGLASAAVATEAGTLLGLLLVRFEDLAWLITGLLLFQH